MDSPQSQSPSAKPRTATPRSSSETIAHPLLGASPATAAAHDDSDDKESLVSTPPVSRSPELPYKPRQKPGSASTPDVPAASVAAQTSTSTTFATPATSSITFSTPPDEPATATSRLQLQSLKAAAQRIGLGNGSQGMAMIDAIFDKGARVRTEAGDWADLLKVLTSGKAIILLPASPASSLPMTPQTLRDHVAFLSPPIGVGGSGDGNGSGSASASVIVTLSGLIGTLRGTTVAFESTVPSDSPLISALRDDARRAGVLGSLRPTQIGSTTAFPSYTLSEDSTVLSFPPLGKSIPLTVEKKEKEPPRRINPFMSLFGSASTTPAPSLRGTLSPERPLSPSPGGGSGVSSPRPSIVSLERVDSNASDALDGYAVTAYTISKPVRFTEVHKSLVKAVRSAVRTELDGLPDRILDKVLRFVLSSVCPVSGSAADQALLKSHHSLGPADSEGVPLDFSDPTVCGERLQDFIEAVYDDLVTYHRQASPSRKRKEGEDGDDDDKDAGEGTERVEALICRLLYNRIFSPLQSDDARHDEALSSRIAALNVLDLSLDHLGLITRPADEDEPGRIARGLGVLVEEIGEELQKLSTYSCLTPKQKADVLVHSHKLAVQGLAKLPPVMLRPEGEPYIPEKEDTLPRIVEQSEPSDRRVSLEDSPTLDASISTVVPETKSTSGADLILPLIIYAVVKANPAQLASQLMYLQRYRSAICLEGEASYAIVNLTAVVEFIEHVQLSELGLPDSQVISVEDLSPIGLTYLDTADAESIMSASSRLRGRVFQVGELAGSAAGSANKVITGVVDSLSSLRGYISEPTTRPRGSSGFSLASVTASVANIAAAATAARTRSRASSQGEYHDRELVQVASRPSSIKPGMYSDESEQEAEDEARSIRSVGSARDATKDKDKETPLGGRLTQMGFKASTPVEKDKGFFGFARQGRRSSTLTLGAIGRSPSGDVALATPTLPDSVSERFMTCQAGDIRMSEVSTLLAEYRRLVAEVERLQGERERG